MKSFVSKAFDLLEEKDFNVLSLTSDGNTANVSIGVQEKIVSGVLNMIISSAFSPIPPIHRSQLYLRHDPHFEAVEKLPAST